MASPSVGRKAETAGPTTVGRVGYGHGSLATWEVLPLLGRWMRCSAIVSPIYGGISENHVEMEILYSGKINYEWTRP